MNITLTPVQARLLGCLIEKEMTTPDYYPLSLNSLTAACNQKSNRDPVLSLSEREVQEALDQLIKQNLAAQRSDFSARVPKYAHKLTGTLTRPTEFSPAELAILCELLVRGPQTPGELRTRAARMHPFADHDEVVNVLLGLATRKEPVVIELPRQAGRREARYHCLWTDMPAEEAATAPAAIQRAAAPDHEARLQALEEQVAELTELVRALQQRNT
ncbi:MAG: YceH family protein [Gammaproteobacteria bacterium]|nr:YceH family protein [Gammaproteobacteria bacterium]